ncbi:MAG: DUF6259 domain-containing protein [Armatimonadetes bacterium]|nr:DUF6259 domain-containing protein [Armatimonadota bacterium]
MTRLAWLTAVAALLCATGAGAQVRVTAPGLTAQFDRGAVTRLEAGGKLLATGGTASAGILRVGAEHGVTSNPRGAATPGKPASVAYPSLQGLSGGAVRAGYSVVGGEIAVTQEASSPQPGVIGVRWAIDGIPFTYNILVPGGGGVRISKRSPGTAWGYDYPITWEAQCVLVEGPGHGLRVWAEDALGRYKRLRVERGPAGWRLTFTTENNAPWAPLKACTSVRWRMAAYKGDWRAGVRPYRDWMARTWTTPPLAKQTPAWARDTRLVVTMDHDLPTLEALATRCDASRTMLYLPQWRAAGYDRMYPNYDAAPGFEAFVRRAHELGFMVMVHANYFGIDPKSPEYARFERYQVRNPNTHALEWWTWDADPPIKFAYINPASSEFRKLLVSRMKEMVERYSIDAIHIDQTLCIFNDENGLIDGMTMIEGNVAIHRELREALPQVALSGEGLDEVTMRYEAFAQRHSQGLDFVQGVWDRPGLAMAHPISSYLFHARTQPYGYLGMTGPANGQLYSAWRENYKRWAVLPTICWPTAKQLLEPTGFLRNALDEARAFARHDLKPDPDGPWPAAVCFPYIGRQGVRAAYREDATGTLFTLDADGLSRTLTRVITGVSEVAAPGSLAGWRCYDSRKLLGLDPEAWYAYDETPRDLTVPHIDQLPEGVSVGRMQRTALGVVAEVRARAVEVGRVAERLMDGRCGWTRPGGAEQAFRGPLNESESGAFFMPMGANLHAHPPWKSGAGGSAFAEFTVAVPAGEGPIRFVTDVAMDKNALGPGKSDGALFTARVVRPGGAEVRVFNATSETLPMAIDLAPYRGRSVTLRLEVGPGPAGNVSFDWARWYRPRVETSSPASQRIGLAGLPAYAAVLSGADSPEPEVTADGILARVDAPGSVYVLTQKPPVVGLPLALRAEGAAVSVVDDAGRVMQDAQFASFVPGGGAAEGVERQGVSAHPPDHGRTIGEFAVTLPAEPARFSAWVALRDGSKSDGCVFIVQANGREVARLRRAAGPWQRLEADLSPWAGKPVVLALITDADGGFNFDWAVWADPRIEAAAGR